MEGVEILVNYGAIGIVLAYMIYKDNRKDIRNAKEFNDTLKGLDNAVQSLREIILLLKERIENE